MLSELHLLVGDLAEAERVSRKAIDFADQSDDWGQSMRCRCLLAAVLHMQGILSEAETLFNEAVELQCSNQPQRPAMNSDHGFLHRRFLLDQAPNRDYKYYRYLLHLSEMALDYDVRDMDHHWLVAIGLGQLSKASSYGHMAEFEPYYQQGATSLFNEAEQLLSDSGSVIYFPELFLEGARFLKLQSFMGQAIQNAKKALRYAMDYEMPLYQADAYLLMAEFNLAIGEIGDVRDALKLARKIIQERGYMRRKQELENLEKLLADVTQ